MARVELNGWGVNGCASEDASCPITIEWFHRNSVKKALRRIEEEWRRSGAEEAMDRFAMVRHDVWLGETGLAPFPEVAAAWAGACPIGLLSGFPDSLFRHFSITHVAINPNATKHMDLQRIQTVLIEAAIDYSIASGWHGWVAWDGDGITQQRLLELGFTHTSFSMYRRMGYFLR